MCIFGFPGIPSTLEYLDAFSGERVPHAYFSVIAVRDDAWRTVGQREARDAYHRAAVPIKFGL